MICGGWHASASNSCLKFDHGKWVGFPWKLKARRSEHVSWTRSNGKTRLLGGYFSLLSSEIVSETGSEAGFSLKHNIWRSCAIEFEDQVIVTGGISALTTVSVYNDNGWVKDLAPLKSARQGHSCGHYTSDEDLKYIVAGGYGNGYISSTEIYSTSKMEWKFGADLPSVRQFNSNGISVHNNVFLLGGYGDKEKGKGFLNDILKLNKENGQWIKVGEMSTGRRGHASAVMPLKNI